MGYVFGSDWVHDRFEDDRDCEYYPRSVYLVCLGTIF